MEGTYYVLMVISNRTDYIYRPNFAYQTDKILSIRRTKILLIKRSKCFLSNFAHHKPNFVGKILSSCSCFCICVREESMNCLAGTLVCFFPFLSSSHSKVLLHNMFKGKHQDKYNVTDSLLSCYCFTIM